MSNDMRRKKDEDGLWSREGDTPEPVDPRSHVMALQGPQPKKLPSPVQANREVLEQLRRFIAPVPEGTVRVEPEGQRAHLCLLLDLMLAPAPMIDNPGGDGTAGGVPWRSER